MTTLSEVIEHLEMRIPGTANHETMVDTINVALMEIGKITKVDETLEIVDQQEKYALPTGISNVVKVQIANDSDNERFTTHYSWREIDGYIYFQGSLSFTTGRTIRLYYNQANDTVEDNDDVINDAIPLPLVVSIAAYRYELLNYQNLSNIGIKDKEILDMLGVEAKVAKHEYRVKKMTRDPILGSD